MQRMLYNIMSILVLMAVLTSTAYSEILVDAGQALPKDLSEATRRAINDAITAVRPALVRILVVTVKYDQGREVKQVISGSGVIISSEGHIITNHHVAGNAKQIFCTLSNKEEIEADLVGTDPLTDIAVIRLRTRDTTAFPFARFGDSSRLEIGDRVLAMGSPFALSQSVTMGIVSNKELIMPRMLWPFNKLTLEGEDVGSSVRWIGHDAPIYGGNSGGPLVNLNGEIIGINEISMGISGAIPGNQAKEVAEALIRSGKVTRSWFGLELQPLLKYSGHQKGVLVSGTIEGSPAERAGFLPGDILIRLAGQEVAVRFPEELPLLNQLLNSLPAGKEIETLVLRKNKEVTLRVAPQERENALPKAAEFKSWGMTARNISLLNAKEMKRDRQEGVLVTTVRPGGACWGATPRIMTNDIIVEVNGVPVRNIKELSGLTDRLAAGKSGPVPVLVAFDRGKERHLTVVKVGTRSSEDPGAEVRKAWLPVTMQVLTKEIAEGLGIPGRKGMRITMVYPHSSAEKSGLRVGDLIVALDGEPITASRPEDFEILPSLIRQYKIGSKAELAIVRDRKEMKVAVELEQSPRSSREMRKYSDEHFEFTARDIAFFDRAREEWDDHQGGVLVEAVGEGGWAALAQLAVGDLITAVDGMPVHDTTLMEKMMKKIAEEKPRYIVLQIQRGIHTMYIELELSWNDIH